MSTAGLPDVDLLIRTGGDHRIRIFYFGSLLMSSSISLLSFGLDFDEQVFSEAIASFASRERRFGCTGEQIRAILAIIS